MARKKAKSQIYWQKRSEERLLDLLDKSDLVAMKLDRYYSVAVKDIKKSIESLYARFEKDNKVDKNKALELIKGDEYKEWRFSMEEYLEKIKATGDEALLLELNTLAMRKRINRLEALEAEILAHSAILADVENENIGDFLEKGLEDSYYKSIYDEYLQKDPKTLELMANNHIKLSKESVNKVLTLPWSGDNYSSNIWKNSYFIAKKTQSLVAKNIIAGKSIDSLTKEFTKVYGDSYRSNVRRLLRTETAYVKSQADVEMYKTLEVEEYEILATLDKRTSAICQEKDGLHYKVDEIAVGVNYPPFHPNCRTTTIKYNPDTEGRTRLAKDKDGKNVKVPFDMKYEERKKWVDGIKDKDDEPLSIDYIKNKIEEIDFQKASKDDIINIGEKLDELHKINELLGDKQAIKDVFSNYRDMGGVIEKSTWVKTSNTKVKKQLEEAMSYYPKEWADKLNSSKKLLTIKTNRGFFARGTRGAKMPKFIDGYDFDDCLTIATDTIWQTTPFHELGHMMEYLNPDILRIEKEFLEYRTKDEEEVPLRRLFRGSGYSPSEVTKPDNFISPYIGKTYPDATEVLSMGLESLFVPGKGQAFKRDLNGVEWRKITDDEEYLHLILGILLMG